MITNGEMQEESRGAMEEGKGEPGCERGMRVKENKGGEMNERKHCPSACLTKLIVFYACLSNSAYTSIQERQLIYRHVNNINQYYLFSDVLDIDIYNS